MRRDGLKKIFITWICVVAFFITSLSPVEYFSIGNAVASVPAEESEADIPKSFGSVDKVFNGEGDVTIYLIPDAHNSLEAQENIASLVTLLTKKKEIKKVYVEGYEGRVPLDELYPYSPEINEKISYHAMDYLRLSGAEYAYVNSPEKNFELIGIENEADYLANLEAYKRAAQNRDLVLEDLNAIKKNLDSLASRLYPKEIKIYQKLKKRLELKKLSLADYVWRLMKMYSQSQGMWRRALESYPDLKLIAENVHKKKLSREEEEALNQKLKAVDYKTFFDELTRFENDFVSKFLNSEAAQKTFYYQRGIELYLKLVNFILVPEEYEELKNTYQNFKTSQLAQFLATHLKKPLLLQKEWEDQVQDAFAFYVAAKKRDADFKVSLPLDKSAIVVVGGFHQAALVDYLKGRKVSYRVIMPRITGRSEKHEERYDFLMSGRYYDYELPYLNPFALAAKQATDPILNELGIVNVKALNEAQALRYFPEKEKEIKLANAALGEEGNEILITGASGDLGANLVRYFNNKGFPAKGVVRAGDYAAKFQLRTNQPIADFPHMEADLYDLEKLKEQIKNTKVLYHLAALVGLSGADEEYPEIFKVNGLVAIGLIKLAEKVRPDIRFVFASSQRVYSVEENFELFTWIHEALDFIDKNSDAFEISDNYEDNLDRLGREFLQTYPFPEEVHPYELSKMLVEEYLKRSSLKNNLILRISNVYGPGTYSGRTIQRMIEGRFKGETIPMHSQIRDYVYIEDVLKILHQAGTSVIFPTGVRDVASGITASPEEIWNLIVSQTPDETGRADFKEKLSIQNEQEPDWGRLLLGGREFTHIETGLRNQIDDIRRKRIYAQPAAGGPVLVIDAGGTNTRFGVWDGEKVSEVRSVPTPNYSSEAARDKTIEERQKLWIEVLNEQIQKYKKRYPDLKQIGIAFAGPVDKKGTIAESTVIWGQGSHPIQKSDLEEKFGLPVTAVNDLTAAVARYGREHKNKEAGKVALVTVSSGIGLKTYDTEFGIVSLDEKGRVGEIGHLVVDDSEDAIFVEDEGPRGILNVYSSGRGAAHLAYQLAFMGEEKKEYSDAYLFSNLHRRIKGNHETIESLYEKNKDELTRLIVETYLEGDSYAQTVVDRGIYLLAGELRRFIVSTAPDVIILMGGFAESIGEPYRQALIKWLVKGAIYKYEDPKEFDRMICFGHPDGLNGLMGMGLLVFDPNFSHDARGKEEEDGYIDVSSDENGRTVVEAVSPAEIHLTNYFEDNVFQKDNPLLQTLIGERQAIFVYERILPQSVKKAIRDYVALRINAKLIEKSGGEQVKEQEFTNKLHREAIEMGLNRKGVFVAIGGGALTDAVGYVASEHRRTMDVIRIPTTLLGQVDAAVGDKVGINFDGVKNIIGGFPLRITTITDNTLLASLRPKQIREGFAEIIKVGIISNPGLFEYLENYGSSDKLLQDYPSLSQFVKDAAYELIKHLQPDFLEKNLMRHVDFGHVIAHKLETASEFQLSHGEAVAIDILFSSFVAYQRGILSPKDFKRIVALHEKLGLNYWHPSMTFENVQAGLQESAEHKGGRLLMVAPQKIGETFFIDSLSEEEVRDALAFLKEKQITLSQKVYEQNPNSLNELILLDRYFGALPDNFLFYQNEIAEAINSLSDRSLLLFEQFPETSPDYEKMKGKFEGLLEGFRFAAEKDGRIRVSDGIRDYYFERGADGKYASQDMTTALSASQIAERIKDKSIFVFNIEHTLAVPGEEVPQGVIENIIRLLADGKVVAFSTYRGLGYKTETEESIYSASRVIRQITNHFSFEPEMIDRLFLYTLGSARKHKFGIKATAVPTPAHSDSKTMMRPVGDKEVSDYTLFYDETGNVTGKIDFLCENPDRPDQITSAFVYSTDAQGNLKTSANGQIVFAWAAGEAVPNYFLSYDSAGNVIGRKKFSYEPVPREDHEFRESHEKNWIISEDVRAQLKQAAKDAYGELNEELDYFEPINFRESSVFLFCEPTASEAGRRAWRLRIFRDRLDSKVRELVQAGVFPEDLYQDLDFRVAAPKGVVVVRKSNSKNGAIQDLAYITGKEPAEMVFFGDEFSGDGAERLLTKIPKLTIVSIGDLMPGDVGLIQYESQPAEGKPLSVERIFDQYFSKTVKISQRPLQTFSSKDLERELLEYNKKVKDLSAEKIHPQAKIVFLREANKLGTVQIEMVLRQILGKTQSEEISPDEVKQFFNLGTITSFAALYKPSIRSSRIARGASNPITFGYRPIAPVVLESIANALADKLRPYVDAYTRTNPDKILYVMGKGVDSLPAGVMVAQELELPFLSLSKQQLPFKGSQKVIKIPEVGVSEDGAERYLSVAISPNSAVLLIDDVATTGRTARNIIRELNQQANVDTIAFGVILQLSEEVENLFKSEIQKPFISLDDLSSVFDDNEIVDVTQRRIPLTDSNLEERYPVEESFNIQTDFYPLQKNRNFVFVDHPLRAVASPLANKVFWQVGKDMATRIEGVIGSLARRREDFLRRGKQLFVLGATPSGASTALAVSAVSRVPLVIAEDQLELEKYENTDAVDVVSYVGTDGLRHFIHGLLPGDGVVLVTGELTDGEEQLRIISALSERGVDVLTSVSAVENITLNGRSRINQAAELNVNALTKYRANESIPHRNRTTYAWDAIKHAIFRLEEEVRKINPDAKVKSMRVIPNSLTGGWFVRDSDLDEGFVFVDGVSQFDLERLQEKFARWLSTEEFNFGGLDQSLPTLVSGWHETAAERRYELAGIPHIEIYKDGVFTSPEAIIESGKPPVVHLLNKHLARIRWMLSSGEMNLSYIQSILDIEDIEKYWRPDQVEKLREIVRTPDELLSKQAVAWVDFMDDQYLQIRKMAEGERVFQINVPSDYRKDFEETLRELLEKNMIRIYGNKIVLVWRHGTVRYSDRFWNEQMTIKPFALSDQTDRTVDDVLRQIEQEWRESRFEYRDLMTREAEIEREEWTVDTPSLLMKFALRKWAAQEKPLSANQKKRLYEAFGLRDAFTYAAAVELVHARAPETIPFLKKKFIEDIDQLSVDWDDPKEYFGETQARMHLLAKVYLSWLDRDKKILVQKKASDGKNLLEKELTQLFDEVLRSERIRKLPTTVFWILTEFFGNLRGDGDFFDFIESNFLQTQIIRFLENRKRNHRYRISHLGDIALQNLGKKHADLIAQAKNKQFLQESPVKTRDAERLEIFRKIEARRKAGQPIDALVADFDETLNGVVHGVDDSLNSQIIFLLKFLLSRDKKVVITTAARFERFHHQALESSYSLPFPNDSNPNFHVFNETVSYLDNQPLFHTEFSKGFADGLNKIMTEKGWAQLRDGRIPREAYLKTGLSTEDAKNEAIEIREEIKKMLQELSYADQSPEQQLVDENYYLTLSPFGDSGGRVIKVYYATKAAVFDAGVSKKIGIKPETSLILANDAIEMGNDKPLFEAGEGALKVHVGRKPVEENDETIQLETLSYDGSLLALEAFVASVLLEQHGAGQSIESMLAPLYEEIRKHPEELETQMVEDMLAHINKLLIRGRMEFLPEEVIALTGGSLTQLGEDLGVEIVEEPVKALLVEDDEALLSYAPEILTRLHGVDERLPKIEVQTARNGQEALTLTQRETFDIIFTDHYMPKMTGKDFAEEFRRTEEKGRHIPIILVTGHAEDTEIRELLTKDLQRAVEERVLTDFFEKPYDKNIFAEYVEKWLVGEVLEGSDVRLGKISEKKNADGKTISVAYQSLAGQQHLQDVYIVYRDDEASRAEYFPHLFGRVHLIRVPGEVREIPISEKDKTASEILPTLPKEVVLQIFENLAYEQRFNLHSLPEILNFDWDANSNNLFEQELAFLKEMRQTAPMGSLLTNGGAFPVDNDGRMILLHATAAKKEMLNSDAKLIFVSNRAMGPVVHTSPLIFPEGTEASEGVVEGRLNGLLQRVWGNLKQRQRTGNPDDHFIAFEVPYAGTAEVNSATNWVDFFGFGLFYLQAFEHLQITKQSKLSPEEVEKVEGQILEQYRSAHAFLRRVLAKDFERDSSNWSDYWNEFEEARAAMPILGQVFFEVFKEYIFLFQNDEQSMRLKEEGVLNLENYYRLVFDLDPGQKRQWNIQKFNPSFEKIIEAFQGVFAEFQPDHFKEFFIRRMYAYLALRFLRGEAKLVESPQNFDDLAAALPNLAGLLHFSVIHQIYSTELPSNPSDFWPRYYPALTQVMHEAYENSNILIPIAGITLPTGDAGIWSMPGIDIEVRDVHFPNEKDLNLTSVSGKLDLQISRWGVADLKYRGSTEEGILASPQEKLEKDKKRDSATRVLRRPTMNIPREKRLNPEEVKQYLRQRYDLDVDAKEMLPLDGGIASLYSGFPPIRINFQIAFETQEEKQQVTSLAEKIRIYRHQQKAKEDSGEDVFLKKKVVEKVSIVLKNVGSNPSRALYIANLMNFLNQVDTSLAPEIVRTLSDELLIHIGENFYVLMQYAKGDSVVPKSANKSHYQKLGVFAADFHVASRGFVPKESYRYSSRREIAEALYDKLGEFEELKLKLEQKSKNNLNSVERKYLEIFKELFPLFQIHLSQFLENYHPTRPRNDHLHGDLHFSNMVFDPQGNIAGVFDFTSQMDQRTVEFNNMLSSIGYGDPSIQGEVRWDMFREIINSYKQRLKQKLPEDPLTPEEEKEIWEMARLQLLINIFNNTIARDRDDKSLYVIEKYVDIAKRSELIQQAFLLLGNPRGTPLELKEPPLLKQYRGELRSTWARNVVERKEITERDVRKNLKLFNVEGKPLPYFGMTVAQMFRPGSAAFNSIKKLQGEIQNELAAAGLAEKFVFPDPNSFHMNLLPFVGRPKNRERTKKMDFEWDGTTELPEPQKVKILSEIEEFFSEEPFLEADFMFSGVSMYPNMLILQMSPKREKDYQAIVNLRNGYRKSGIEVYRDMTPFLGHVTLAYFVQPLNETEYADFVNILKKYRWVPPVSFKISDHQVLPFSDMNTFGDPLLSHRDISEQNQSLGQVKEYQTSKQLRSEINQSVSAPIPVFIHINDLSKLSEKDRNELIFYIYRKQAKVIVYGGDESQITVLDIDPDLAALKAGGGLEEFYGDDAAAYKTYQVEIGEGKAIHLSKNVEVGQRANNIRFRYQDGQVGTLTAAIAYWINNEKLEGVKRENGYLVLDLTDHLAVIVQEYQASFSLARAA